jgi:hypothetical protein
MSTTADCTTAADRALQALPVDLRDEASALAWHLFQEQGMDWGAATIEAVTSVTELLEFAAEWDAEADEALLTQHCPCLANGGQDVSEPCATIGRCLRDEPAPPSPAERKAQYHLARGLDVVRGSAGWLIPSGTRAGVVHYVSDAGICTCEAGQRGRACWHVSAARHVAAQKAA